MIVMPRFSNPDEVMMFILGVICFLLYELRYVLLILVTSCILLIPAAAITNAILGQSFQLFGIFAICAPICNYLCEKLYKYEHPEQNLQSQQISSTPSERNEYVIDDERLLAVLHAYHQNNRSEAGLVSQQEPIVSNQNLELVVRPSIS